jgi:plasmid maintenance system antidote protein VapI
MARKKKAVVDEFQPNWCTPPGGTIQDVLSARGMTHAEFAYRMAIKLEDVQKLVDGDIEINLDIAQRLCSVLGRYDVKFWLNHERLFREGLSKGLKKVS